MKSFFVFLLVFFISIADVNLYAKENTNSYFLSSKVVKAKRVSNKKTKHIVFNKTLSFNYFLVYLLPDNSLTNVFQEQILLTLKLQKQLYQKIALQNIQHIFLSTKITSCNSISTLYIA